eukprot:351897-Chlamydomonas_euryale.AAC.7
MAAEVACATATVAYMCYSQRRVQEDADTARQRVPPRRRYPVRRCSRCCWCAYRSGAQLGLGVGRHFKQINQLHNKACTPVFCWPC